MLEIHRDKVGMPKLSMALISVHLQHLDRFRADLPLLFCLPFFNGSDPSTVLSGANARQKNSIVCPSH